MSASPERLRAWVQEDFGVELGSLNRVGDGVDFAAEVWHGNSTDDKDYAVKWSGGGSVAGILVPALLADRGVAGVPAPLRAGDGRPWSERDGRRLSVVPWVSDEGALNGAMTRERWVSFGRLLAQAHATDVPAEVAAQLPREHHTHERWVNDARRLDLELSNATSDDPLVQELAAMWGAAAERIAAIGEWADELASELREETVPFVLCHADPHRGNLLLTGRQAWLIDWDDAMLAPRERDLMFVLSDVHFFAPDTEQERAWFFQGYGPVELDPRRIAYHQCVRTFEDFVGPALQVLDLEGESLDDRTTALRIARDALSPGGLATSVEELLRRIRPVSP